MSLKVYINDEWFDKENAKVSVYDHGFLYGDGVFEGMRVYARKVFRCREHLDRLFESAKAIGLTIPMSKEDIESKIYQTLEINDLAEAYVRLIVTRGIGLLGLDPNKCTNPQVIIITDSIVLYPDELYERGLEVVTVATIRNHPNALSPRIKSLNYLNNILAKIEAMQAGVIEAIMLNSEGYVAECTGDNLFIVDDGALITPPPEAGILKGITRAVVMELAEREGIPVLEKNLTRMDLYIADECFLTGSAAEIAPVVRIDSRVIGDGVPGPVTLRLLDLFREETRR